ncbi:hypothetical protein [Paraburkholderia sp. J7]|uniref:hypothetical protein n=1 Tax=Paraburkholderia sp. J7 TaxID=2805438 RepID=UPI002AB63505|nr:hypothetical protein [Paraburkholderia sp. J7]
MAFNVPPPMNIDDPAARVHLTIAPGETGEQAAKMIREPGLVENHDVRISSRMRARLSAASDAVVITELSEAVQGVSDTEPTNWYWAVKPLKSGEIPLHVSLEALLKIDGEVTPRLVKVYDGSMTVTVTGIQRLEEFSKENWKWLWTAILVPVTGVFWKRKEKPKGDESTTVDD